MSRYERYSVPLTTGILLHQISQEGTLFGHLEMQPDGRARIWCQTWVDTYAPTKDTFPGFVSAARALIAGIV